MTANRLLAHYEQIADAPDATGRLRRFILDLAVRGKLVPQDSNDEPAAELLRRIVKEKARLVAEGGFNSLEPVEHESATAEPFAIPSTWVWCLLDDIAGIARGGSPRPIKAFLTEDANGIPWIKIGDSTRGDIYINSTEERIKPEGLSRSRLVVPGDLLLSNSMSFGYPYITNISGCIHDGWLVIRTPEDGICKLYIHCMFLSEYAKQAFQRSAAGAVVQNLNADKVRRLLVPLPPHAEQHRIVAKVDELMGLCDRLEAARAERETRRDQLAASSLARLNAPNPETFQDDVRFVLNALPALTTRADQVKQLRQTILNLAVRGKLVPHDPKDEPAAELLKRVALEKARQVKVGEIRKGHPLPPISKAELPFELPDGWAWTRLGDVIHLVSGQHLQPSEYSEEPKAGIPYITGPSDFAAEGLQITRFALVRKAVAKMGQLLLTVKGSGVGKTTICDLREVAISRQLMALTAIEWDDRFLLLITHRLAERLQAEARSLIPGISREDVDAFVLPLPPLAEQQRIVAKVDKLMTTCDQLEAALTDTAATRRRLLDALLAEALAPAIEQVEAA